jgi:glycosyltransferase involved in cell wall biosynthesis
VGRFCEPPPPGVRGAAEWFPPSAALDCPLHVGSQTSCARVYVAGVSRAPVHIGRPRQTSSGTGLVNPLCPGCQLAPAGRLASERDDRDRPRTGSAVTGTEAGPITFLMHDAFGEGGVARTTANLANQLALTRDVRVISVVRRRERPQFDLHDNVEVTVLDDVRGGGSRVRRPLRRIRSRLRPLPSEESMSLLTDVLLRRAIRDVDSGAIVSTRPSLHLALTTYARAGVATVGWEHLNFPARSRNPRLMQVLRTAVPRLDGCVVLTDADAEDWRRELPGLRTPIEVIRNSVAWPIRTQPVEVDSKVVVAAGRLVPRKGFRRLVRAFAPVARRHRDWQLHIYGTGPQKREIADLIRRLDLESQVLLRGYSRELPEVLARASVLAMTSFSEGFPMVLIEAMSTGTPLIAFDCPRGPAEIIRHGSNGLLIPQGPVGPFTRGLETLVQDAGLRARLGAQGLRDAQAYTVENIGADWERFVARLNAR